MAEFPLIAIWTRGTEKYRKEGAAAEFTIHKKKVDKSQTSSIGGGGILLKKGNKKGSV